MAGRGLRVFGHPLHAILSHFPIALLTLVPAADLLGLLRPGAVPPAVTFFALAAGLAVALPTAGAGFVDYVAVDDASPAARAALVHLAWVLGAVAVDAAALFLRASPSAPVSLPALGVEGAGALLLGVGAWWGGELVFRHHVGSVTEG